MSKRLKGLYQNCDPVDQPEGFYRDARNIVLSESQGAVSNEQGTILQASIPEGNIVIGKQLLSDESVVIFSVSKTSENSEIGIFLDGTYTSLINNSLLNFSIEHPIQADTTVNDFDEQIVVWTDGLNQPRWLNVDNPVSDINYTSIFPYSEDHPFIKIDSIDYGEGSLNEGVYYFAIAYMDNDSNDVISDFYNVIGPVNVRPPWENTGSSAITFSIEGRDNHYDNIQVAVIKKIDNVIDQIELLPEIGKGITSYTYTGNESDRPGSLAEIQIDNAYYPTVQTLHINDDKLYMGNLEEGKDIGYQPYALDIKAHLVEETPPTEIQSYHPENQINNIYYKGYFKGETYAFYISWLLKEGGETKAYHIPGRASDDGDIDEITDAGVNAIASTSVTRNVGSPNSGDTDVSFEFDGETTTVTLASGTVDTDVVNEVVTAINADATAKMTASGSGDRITFIDEEKRSSINGTPVTITFDEADWAATGPDQPTSLDGDLTPFFPTSPEMIGGADPGQTVSTTKFFQKESIKDPTFGMGYWENENEVYPDSDDWISDSGEDFRDSPVRHHSFPDVKYLEGDFKYTYPVGIRFTNVQIPAELKGKVSGYKIYYAEHSDNNKKIIDQALLINSTVNMSDVFKDGEPIYESTPFNGFADESSSFDENLYVKYSHPFRLLRKRLDIQGISHIQIVDQTELSQSTDVDFKPSWENNSSTTHTHYIKITDHTLNQIRQYSGSDNIDLFGKSYINSSKIRNRVELSRFGFNYTMNNYSGESKLIIRTKEEFSNDNYYIANFRTTKKDLYNSFDQQILVHTGYVHTDLINLDSNNIYGGDAFTNQQYTIKANNTPDSTTYVGVHKIFGLQSYDNLFMRKSGEEPWETFYPIVDEKRLSSMYFAENGEPRYTKVAEEEYATKHVDNYFDYDDGESSVNNIKFAGIFEKNPKRIHSYPTRVIRSDSNFRIFRQDDFLDLSRKRGDLIKLTTYNNILIPHMQKALVRTRGQEELQVDEITAFLGTGNIFGVKPQEIIYTEDGFGGLLDKTHSMSTPFGYFFYDAFSKRIYRLDNNGLQDITDPILPLMKEFDISSFFIPSPQNLTYIEI